MKKLILLSSMIIVGSTIQAQQRFHTFMYNEKYGLTDTLGKEIIKPIHRSTERFGAKNEIVFYNYDEEIKDVIFNESTGAMASYGYIHPDEVDVQEKSYSYIKDKGKHYLRSQVEDKTLQLKRTYYDLVNVGNYIIGKYYADPPPSPPSKSKKDKNGNWLPPEIVKAPSHDIGSYGYDVMTNDESLKVLMKGVFVSYLPLYADDRKVGGSSDEVVNVEIIELKEYNNADFDAIVFSADDTHSLYNASMTLVKKFELKDATKEQLTAKASTIMKLELLDYDRKNAAPPMMAPPMGPGPSSRGDNLPHPPVVYPIFSTKKLENGNTQFIMQKSEKETKVIFETKHSVRLSERDAIIRITDSKDKDSKFNYSPSTGVLFLPKQYWSIIGLIVK